MPYTSRNGLPESVKHALVSVPHAQDIYKEAFNSAWKEYKSPKDRRDNVDREEVSHRVAWSAVKQKYEKGADEKWHPKHQ